MFYGDGSQDRNGEEEVQNSYKEDEIASDFGVF